MTELLLTPLKCHACVSLMHLHNLSDPVCYPRTPEFISARSALAAKAAAATAEAASATTPHPLSAAETAAATTEAAAATASRPKQPPQRPKQLSLPRPGLSRQPKQPPQRPKQRPLLCPGPSLLEARARMRLVHLSEAPDEGLDRVLLLPGVEGLARGIEKLP